MSLLKVSGNASGSGTVTLLAPNTNSTRTLDLPDIDGTILTNNSNNVLRKGAAIATTSGTEVTLATGLPSGIIRVNVGLYGVSSNSTSRIIIQFGTGSTPTYVTTGYTSASDNYQGAAGPAAAVTNGFPLGSTNAALSFWYVIYQFVNIGSNQWVGGISGFFTPTGVVLGGGAVTLGAELSAIRLTTTAGTGVFDGGSATVFYE